MISHEDMQCSTCELHDCVICSIEHFVHLERVSCIATTLLLHAIHDLYEEISAAAIVTLLYVVVVLGRSSGATSPMASM